MMGDALLKTHTSGIGTCIPVKSTLVVLSSWHAHGNVSIAEREKGELVSVSVLI